ncbi:hypothetical protein [Rhodococcus sp. NPDC059234]|uniref:baeRF11 domain-containing protein n=1 Tax=Rhodococcus sp. NPDC059234 TaxID=3346781 RepID=UPI00366F0C82
MLHNDVPSQNELATLAAVEGRTCLSIYTPMDAALDDPEANRIAFANQAKSALEAVQDKSERDTFEEALGDLADDDDFWRYQSRTLVVLAEGEHVHVHRIPNRLEAVERVGDRYFLKPLLRAVTFPQTAFVLALAEGSVRLVEVSAEYPAETVRVPDLPTSAADHAGKASLSGRAPKGRLQGTEGRKLRVRQYCRAVDQALRPVLTGRDVPLILAATEPVSSIYRSVNSYPALLAEGLDGNPEERSDEELATLARGVLDRHYAAELARTRELFETRRSQGRAQTDLTDIGRSATFGLVDTLFVDIDSFVPGTIDPESGVVELTGDDTGFGYGVIDEMARRTLLQGGRILAVRAEDVPEGAQAAAILRYAG